MRCDIAFRWVLRKNNLLFTSNSNKNKRNSISRLLGVNVPYPSSSMYLSARRSRNCQNINAAHLPKDYVIVNKDCDEHRETNPETTESGNMKT